MERPNHILVIRLSAMGDVAMTIPVLRVVARTYPNLKLTVVSRKFYEPLFKSIPNIHFLEADVYGKHKGIRGLIKLSKECNLVGCDAVADLHNVIRSKIITFLWSLKRKKTAVIDKGRSEKKKLTDANNEEIYPLKQTHLRYADVFAQLGFPVDLNKHIYPDRKRLSPRLLTIVGKDPKKKCIGIAPFAAYKSKMYPLPLMEEVVKRLNETQHYKILLFGGGKEEITQLKAIANTYPHVTNVAGNLTFDEELDLISNLDAMVAMDSSNGHLAALYNVPVITLWGVTHPYAGFVPFAQPMEHQLMADQNKYPLIPTSIYGNKYPKGYETVMQDISVDSIVEKIFEILAL